MRSSAFGVVIEKMVFNRDAWLENRIPLPCVEEQRRIVSRIEELAAKVEEAQNLQIATLRDVPLLKRKATDTIFDSLQCDDNHLADLLREESLNGISVRPEESGPGVEILRISAGTSREDALVDESM